MKVLGIALIILLLLMLSGIPSLISSRFLDSDAKTVNYTVYYVDDNNVPIGQAVYKGKAGKKITFVTRDKDGYTLQNPKQSIVLSENPDENHLTFIYTKTTSVKFRI